MKSTSIGIVGAGTMGNGIAHVFSLFDFDVLVVDIDKSILDKAKSTIVKNMNRQLKKGTINSQKMADSLDRILFSKSINDLKECDLVVEAIKEDIDVKSRVFADLDSICKKSTILASNTSSISINKLAESTKRPDKVIGMHSMNPVPIMKLIEIN